MKKNPPESAQTRLAQILAGVFSSLCLADPIASWASAVHKRSIQCLPQSLDFAARSSRNNLCTIREEQKNCLHSKVLSSHDMSLVLAHLSVAETTEEVVEVLHLLFGTYLRSNRSTGTKQTCILWDGSQNQSLVLRIEQLLHDSVRSSCCLQQSTQAAGTGLLLSAEISEPQETHCCGAGTETPERWSTQVWQKRAAKPNHAQGKQMDDSDR